MPSVREKVRIVETQTLSDDWYLLKKYTFDYQRRDGQWQRQSREAYDRGNGATILLYNRAERCVILTRQFRLPVFLNGYDGLLTETAAGLLDEADPETRIRAEAEEETGYLVDNVEKVFEAYMSPGSVTEKLYFFTGEYDPARRSGAGGEAARAAASRKKARILRWSKCPLMTRCARCATVRLSMPKPSCCCNTRR